MCGKDCEGSQVAPLARGTRTMKRCSFDMRSGGATWSPSCQDAFRSGWRMKVEDEKDWKGTHVGLCAPGTRALRRALFDGRT